MHILRKIGDEGECLAAQYLQARGYRLVAKNFTVHRRGEIDLVMEKDEFLVCVEIKTRCSNLVPLAALVPWRKQQRIIFAARVLVQRLQLVDKVVRFDVVFIDLSAGSPAITHFQSAFWSA